MAVESDGRLLVSRDDCTLDLLMNHDMKYRYQGKSGHIMRYLITRPFGYALLLGSSRYKTSEGPLKCVETDLAAMEVVLRDSGWDMDAPYGCNAEKEGYEEKIQELRQANLEKYSCFLFYFSGHGSHEGMLFQPDGGVVAYKNVIDDVIALEHFRGKPKILIFDCCRTECGGSESNAVKSLGEKFASKYHDTIVCFACTDNTTSMALGDAGSIFTQNFVMKLDEFGRELSFVDLLTQAKGETYMMTKSRFGPDKAQQPVSYSGLNSQLLLKETCLIKEDMERAKHSKNRIVLVPLRSGVDLKGPLERRRVDDLADPSSHSLHPPPTPVSENTSSSPPGTMTTDTATPRAEEVTPRVEEATPRAGEATPMDTTTAPPEPVMKDHVTTKVKFTSRHDVVSNLSSLGRGHHVFLCYLPDPASPYGTPDPTRVSTNLSLVSLLQYDLTRHGFAVTSDLSLGDQEPVNLLQWYIRQIERCDHVILVCSPALKELFSTSQPRETITDPKAQRFQVYSAAIYSECERCMRSGVGKFVPVVLQPDWQINTSVPLLFCAGHIYELYGRRARMFDYDNKTRHFEQMVCRMVGINRRELDAPRPGAPITFTSSSSVEDVNRSKYLAQANLPRPGYVTVQSRVGQGASQRSSWEDTWAKVPLDDHRNHHFHPPPSYSTSQTAGGGSGAGRGHGARVYGNEPTNTTASLTAALSSTEDTTPPHDQRHYVAPNYGATPSPVPPPHPAPSFPSTNTHADPASLLPLTPPPISLLLWLSEHVIQWKFLGRYLDVKEHDLERIALESPNDIREQCFQMLKRFSMEGGSQSTCQKLGRALLESEKNKHLFAQFCERVSELAPNEG